MENALRRLIRNIVDDPLLIKLIQEEIQRRDVNSGIMPEHLFGNRNQLETNKILISKDCRFYLTDYNNQELDIPGYQARALYVLYLLNPEAISNQDLIEYKDELIEIYLEICKDRQFDLFRAEVVIDGLIQRKGSPCDAANHVRVALNKIISDKQSLKDYVISGQRKGGRKIHMPKEMIKVENLKLREIMEKLSKRI